LIAPIDLDGNGIEQPPKLGIVEVFKRTREVARSVTRARGGASADNPDAV
jgi:hypothetical protein